MKVIIYGDFNCLYCHLASQRADRLVRAGTANVEWRAVEHRPPTATSTPAPDGLRCLAEIMGPAALSGRAAPGLPGLIGQTGQCHHRPFRK